VSSKALARALETVNLVAALYTLTFGFTELLFTIVSTGSIGSLPGSGSAWLKALTVKSHVNEKRKKWISKSRFMQLQLVSGIEFSYKSKKGIKYDL